MKKLLLLFLLFSSCLVNCTDTSKDESSALELASIFLSNEALDKQIKNEVDELLKLIAADNCGGILKKDQALLEEYVISSMNQYWLQAKGIFSEAFEKELNKDEIQILINFFKSVLGQKYINEVDIFARNETQKMKQQVVEKEYETFGAIVEDLDLIHKEVLGISVARTNLNSQEVLTVNNFFSTDLGKKFIQLQKDFPLILSSIYNKIMTEAMNELSEKLKKLFEKEVKAIANSKS